MRKDLRAVSGQAASDLAALGRTPLEGIVNHLSRTSRGQCVVNRSPSMTSITLGHSSAEPLYPREMQTPAQEARSDRGPEGDDGAHRPSPSSSFLEQLSIGWQKRVASPPALQWVIPLRTLRGRSPSPDHPPKRKGEIVQRERTLARARRSPGGTTLRRASLSFKRSLGGEGGGPRTSRTRRP